MGLDLASDGVRELSADQTAYNQPDFSAGGLGLAANQATSDTGAIVPAPVPKPDAPAPSAALPVAAKASEGTNPWALALAGVADGILTATGNKPYAMATLKGLEDTRLKRRQLDLEGFKIGVDATKHGLEMLDKIPDSQRAAFAEKYSENLKQLGGDIGPAAAEAFAAMKDAPDAAARAGLVANFSPSTQSLMLSMSNGNSSQLVKILGNRELMQGIRDTEDSNNRASIISKFQAVQAEVAKVSPDLAKALGENKVTLADFQTLAKKLGIPLETWENATFARSTSLQAELGLATPKAREAGQEAVAKEGARAAADVAAAGPKAAAVAGAEDPFKKSFEAYKQGLEQNREIAVNAAKLAAKDPQNEFKNANTLRDEYRASSKDFVTVQDAYGKITEAAKSKTGAGDMAMLYAYIKLLDPQTGVREGEFATAAATGSFGEKVQGAVAKIATGERMPDSLRNDFLDQAKKIYGVQQETQKQVAGEYTRIAQRNKIDPNDVIVQFDRDIGNGLRAVPDADLRAKAADPAKLSPSEAAALVSEFKRRGLK